MSSVSGVLSSIIEIYIQIDLIELTICSQSSNMKLWLMRVGLQHNFLGAVCKKYTPGVDEMIGLWQFGWFLLPRSTSGEKRNFFTTIVTFLVGCQSEPISTIEITRHCFHAHCTQGY